MSHLYYEKNIRLIISKWIQIFVTFTMNCVYMDDVRTKLILCTEDSMDEYVQYETIHFVSKIFIAFSLILSILLLSIF